MIKVIFKMVAPHFLDNAIGNHISLWKPKILYDGKIKHPTASNNTLNAALNYINTKSLVISNGSCLKQEQVTFNHK